MATGGVTDLRSVGSGNPGAANAIAQLGPAWGYTVLVADVTKAAAACAVARWLAGDTAAHVAGTAAVVGHCYPVWNGFKGGKGVAASAGQCLATFPAYTPIDLGVAALSAASPRWKSRAHAATVLASAAWVAGGVVWWRTGWRNGWGPVPTVALPLAAAASSGVILHRFAASAKATTTATAATAAATGVVAAAPVSAVSTTAPGAGR
jgi:glycerol-3-phosphate acyltransferase PlsY